MKNIIYLFAVYLTTLPAAQPIQTHKGLEMGLQKQEIHTQLQQENLLAIGYLETNKLNNILPQVIIHPPPPPQFKTEEIYSFNHSSIIFTTWANWNCKVVCFLHHNST
jgi:hypothetical protein